MSAKLKREVGNWVSGDKFWGRAVELQSFIELLDEGANILLTAPRRTGKTSLMREVVRRLEERQKDIAIYVDLEHSQSPEDAIVEISLATVRIRMRGIGSVVHSMASSVTSTSSSSTPSALSSAMTSPAIGLPRATGSSKRSPTCPSR